MIMQAGVAVMLELAKILGSDLKPKRTIVFVAFTGEEAGLIGSQYFVDNFGKLFSGKPFADINLDTDGSLFDKKIMILNANTAKEWKFIFMGTDYTTGFLSQIVENDLDASDQKSFIKAGIPAIQVFAGATENYHRPSDTKDKIDAEGMLKIATVVREVVEYLGDREDPMDFIGNNNSQSQDAKPQSKSNRKASTGAVPDFAYNGKGVKISSVMDGSPGQKAGLQKDDVITALNGVEVDNLRSYSDELKKYNPGEEVEITVKRINKNIKINLVLGER
ncbi:MAG: M20/M25/M40 family metallo-hydrolase [Saprospiraceae bacterium]